MKETDRIRGGANERLGILDRQIKCEQTVGLKSWLIGIRPVQHLLSQTHEINSHKIANNKIRKIPG